MQVVKQLLLNPNIKTDHVAKDGSTALSVADQNGDVFCALQEFRRPEYAYELEPSTADDNYYDDDSDVALSDQSDSCAGDSTSDDSELNEAVIQAMSEGSGNIKVSLITLHGPPGAGKTSLKRLLLGEPPLPPKEQNSTPIMDQPARAITTTKLGLKADSVQLQLEVVNETKILELLAGHIQQQVKNSSNYPLDECVSHTISATSNNNHNTTGTNNTVAQHNVSSLIPASNSLPSPILSAVSQASYSIQHPLSVEMTDVLKDLVENLKHVKHHGSQIFNMHWFHIIDSGGQPQFQDVLPLLFHNQSLHIVVIRLNEQLDEKPKFRFICEGKEIRCLPTHLTLTNFQIIERTCQLAQASCTSGNRQPPWVMVVGTHLDLIEECNETLEAKNERLKKLCEEYNNVLICKSQEEVIFSVNAMVEVGDQRQKDTNELQHQVIHAPTIQDNVSIPIRWFALELELGRISKEDKGIVPIERCYEVAGTLGMTEEETDAALKYFTKVAIHLYYPKPLPHLLFTQMKPVVDQLSLLVSTSFTHPSFGPDDKRKKLKQKGIFNVNYLDQLNKALDHLTNSDFLKLLQHLHIAVHISGEKYFLPCALSLSDEDRDFIPSLSHNCDPLVFKWNDKIIPCSFFPTLVANLLQHKASFSLPKKEVRHQYRHRVSIRCLKLPGLLCLVDATHWIELHYSTPRRTA